MWYGVVLEVWTQKNGVRSPIFRIANSSNCCSGFRVKRRRRRKWPPDCHSQSQLLQIRSFSFRLLIITISVQPRRICEFKAFNHNWLTVLRHSPSSLWGRLAQFQIHRSFQWHVTLLHLRLLPEDTRLQPGFTSVVDFLSPNCLFRRSFARDNLDLLNDFNFTPAGLSFRTTEESLRNAFKSFGQLVEGRRLVLLCILNVPFCLYSWYPALTVINCYEFQSIWWWIK